MVDFSFRKKQDRYYVTNNETADLTYTLKKLSECDTYLHVFGGTIPAGEEVEITFFGDGDYQVLLVNDSSEESTIYIKYYKDFLMSLLNDIEIALCDCGCECHDCDGKMESKECSQLMVTVTKLMTYKGLIFPEATAHFQAIYGFYKCMIDDLATCMLNAEKYSGVTEYNKTLLKKIIALNYLSLYHYELSQACLQEDLTYVRNKFASARILSCIGQLGICVDSIENKLENMANFTIESAAYVNQPPSQVGDNNIAVDNRAVTVLTMAMFTTGTTPVYVDPEGDPADAVRIDTLPADGVLKLNGSNVTAGQVILATDINLNLLTFESPNQDAFDSDVFTFSVRDSGSGQFTS